jgi:CRP-like cAMP-binding protein
MKYSHATVVAAHLLMELCPLVLLPYFTRRSRPHRRDPEGDRELLRSVLTGLDDSQIARLLNAGRFVDLAEGATLAEEDEALKRILFICSGRASVMIGGREVSHLEKGSFVGEVAFLTDKRQPRR